MVLICVLFLLFVIVYNVYFNLEFLKVILVINGNLVYFFKSGDRINRIYVD